MAFPEIDFVVNGEGEIPLLHLVKNLSSACLNRNFISVPGLLTRSSGAGEGFSQFALPFRPLKAAPFWLGYGSPVWRRPEAFGIRKVCNHPFYRHLFPPEIFSQLHLILQGYQGGMKKQQRLWRRVTKALKSWRTTYENLHGASNRDPILSYQDGGTFLIIRQRRLVVDNMTHRLRGAYREIYLFCERNRSVSEIVQRFPGFGQEKILPFLSMMVDKKLMFREGERFLSLAVPIRGYRSRK